MRRVFAATLLAALVGTGVGVVLLAADVRPLRVTSNSMAPTVAAGEWILIEQGERRDFELARGDVVVFRYPPGTDGRAIKRVAGLPGDRVAGTTVPAGRVFVLGDNAASSIDSRQLGALPETEIVGRQTAVLGSPTAVAGWMTAALATIGIVAWLGSFVRRLSARTIEAVAGLVKRNPSPSCSTVNPAPPRLTTNCAPDSASRRGRG